MCTVTYFKYNDTVILTSNRDEHTSRPNALAPKMYMHGNTKLYYPKDPKANGTWFVQKDNNEALILLNGAEKKHISKPPYRKSRGLILLEIAEQNNILIAWRNIDLDKIEPFTIVAFIAESLYQLRWNGKEKNNLQLNENLPHIWSSSTLYTPKIIANRKNWFHDFLKSKNANPTNQDLIDFHTNTHTNDLENGLIINRNQEMLTKNISQTVLRKNGFQLRHYDLVSNQELELRHEIVVA